MPQHLIVDVAEVAGDANAGTVARLDDEARRIGRIVKRPAGVHIQLADGKGGVVLEDHERRFLSIDGARVERSPG